jgi:hypothetical protein
MRGMQLKRQVLQERNDMGSRKLRAVSELEAAEEAERGRDLSYSQTEQVRR